MKNLLGAAISTALGLLACSAPANNTAPPATGPPAHTDTTAPVTNAGPVFITLGTGGGTRIRTERAESANAMLVNGAVYVFDAGGGTIRQLTAAKLPLRQLRAVFISHHHLDHNAGLAPVLLNRWLLSRQPQPLPILGPPGTVALVRGLTAAYHVAELAPVTNSKTASPSLASTLAPHDLAATMNAPQLVYQDENLRVLAVTNTHYHFPAGSAAARFSRSYAYRIETPGRTFVYTGDTGPSAHVERLARGADVLVSEVIDTTQALAQRRAQASPAALRALAEHLRQDHLTPTEVGKLAAAAGVKQVVLTHLGPGADGETDLSGYTRGLGTYYSGPVRVARDLDRF